jgi:hypothetical protein
MLDETNGWPHRQSHNHQRSRNQPCIYHSRLRARAVWTSGPRSMCYPGVPEYNLNMKIVCGLHGLQLRRTCAQHCGHRLLQCAKTRPNPWIASAYAQGDLGVGLTARYEVLAHFCPRQTTQLFRCWVLTKPAHGSAPNRDFADPILQGTEPRGLEAESESKAPCRHCYRHRTIRTWVPEEWACCLTTEIAK